MHAVRTCNKKRDNVSLVPRGLATIKYFVAPSFNRSSWNLQALLAMAVRQHNLVWIKSAGRWLNGEGLKFDPIVYRFMVTRAQIRAMLPIGTHAWVSYWHYIQTLALSLTFSEIIDLKSVFFDAHWARWLRKQDGSELSQWHFLKGITSCMVRFLIWFKNI